MIEIKFFLIITEFNINFYIEIMNLFHVFKMKIFIESRYILVPVLPEVYGKSHQLFSYNIIRLVSKSLFDSFFKSQRSNTCN